MNMESDEPTSIYRIWGNDGIIYGPLDLATLLVWAKESRVVEETWVYHAVYDRWQKASLLPELQMHFRSATARPAKPEPEPSPSPSLADLQPKPLRRIRVFANFSDTELGIFMGYMDAVPTKQWDIVVKQGDPGDGMYLVLEGELRVRMIIMSKETVLTTLSAGDFFGEVSLFDHGPRTADVVANQESLLLKISAASFTRLVNENPQLAAPFLQAICKTLTARIRADNKRFRESVKLIRSASHYNNL